MHGRLAEPWTLEALAREAGLSRAAFAARFRETVGEPALRCLLRLRMRHATGMLEGGTGLAAVGAAVGYGSEAAFSAAFKRHLGQSPGANGRAVREAARDPGPPA